MEKILIHHYSEAGTATVLQAFGDRAEAIGIDCGLDWDDWPEDLGIYHKETGLYVWEGEIDLDDNFTGEFRSMTPEEAQRFINEGRAWV